MSDAYRANLALWNEWTEINARSSAYGLDTFKAGRSSLHPLEVGELGPVAGKSLLHLQCHFGMDTLSWARLGAVATGVDFSDRAIALAQQLSRECGVPARFILSDLYALPGCLDEAFDIVYTSYGVLPWLPDLVAWAGLVSRYLRPGGTFYMAEFHPFADLFDEGDPGLRIGEDYFKSEAAIWPVEGSYADRQAVVHQKISYEWTHPLSEVLSALLSAGICLEHVHEFPYSVYPQFTFLEQGEDGYFYLPGKAKTIPLMYSIKGRRDEQSSTVSN
jgi:ubiquinone/menaquinone biosynthesis C-methylase UbiE